MILALTLGLSLSHAAPGTQAAPPLEEGQAQAIFAGGCFWCMEKPFDVIDGVLSTTSGYTGGTQKNPTYEQVSRKQTTHIEAIRIVYDPSKVTYAQLLNVFWHNVDPTQANGQFCDSGPQYRTAIFPSSAEERSAAEASKAKVEEQLSKKVYTDILDASVFWVAEDYHQDYYKTNPTRYSFYRWNCGRDQRLEEIWGDQAGH